MEVTFFLKQDEVSGKWQAYSVISTIAGYGATKQAAIDNHIKKFNEAHANSMLEEVAKRLPNVTITKCSFVLADERPVT